MLCHDLQRDPACGVPSVFDGSGQASATSVLSFAYYLRFICSLKSHLRFHPFHSRAERDIVEEKMSCVSVPIIASPSHYNDIL